MANKKKVITRYTARDFNTIRQDLREFAKRYYPNTYKNFNETSFGAMVIDETSYVGDILSFYLDYSANESFLDTALEYDNILKHGKSLGYRFNGRPTAYGQAVFYVLVPASTTAQGPDSRYIPRMLKGSEFATDSGNNFILNEDVDFSHSSNEIVVAEVNDDTGIPTFFAIKAYGEVISGELIRDTIQIGSFERFRKVNLNNNNIAEILTVFDDEGHEYFEVDYLSRDVVYKPIINRASDKDMAPSILKAITVPRRFTVFQDRDSTTMQFGYGSDEEIREGSVVDPAEVAMKLVGKDYITDTSFDPYKLVSSDKFGIGPSNTTLTVISRINTSTNVNASIGSLISVVNPVLQFDNIADLDPATVNTIVGSVEVNNETSIVGDVTLPSSEELKIRIKDRFSTQDRAVTAKDYESLIYNMPPRFGSIKRCRVVPDQDSFKRNLNIYIISENEAGTLTTATNSIKKNLKNWLRDKKMINDTIDILDSYIINIGIEFEAISELGVDRFAVLESAIEELQERYLINFEIGEPFSITNVYSALKTVPGLVDVTNVSIVPKVGGQYSDWRIDLDLNTSPDGRFISIPERGIFEIRFPASDIKGVVK